MRLEHTFLVWLTSVHVLLKCQQKTASYVATAGKPLFSGPPRQYKPCFSRYCSSFINYCSFILRKRSDSTAYRGCFFVGRSTDNNSAFSVSLILQLSSLIACQHFLLLLHHSLTFSPPGGFTIAFCTILATSTITDSSDVDNACSFQMRFLGQSAWAVLYERTARVYVTIFAR